MGGARIKPEPSHIRGICITEGCINPQVRRDKNNYRAHCASCHNKRHNIGPSRFKYRKFKKDVCEECGFVPVHPCQLDVDHVDGNHKNDDPSNLRTLCANCHRLKTYLNRDCVSNSSCLLVQN